MTRRAPARTVPTITADQVPLSSRPAEQVQGHWLLARLGKRVLRPGGLQMTRALLENAGVTEQHVVEFAPGLGRTATLVLDHSPAGYVGVDADPKAAEIIDRIVSPRGRAIAAEAASSGLPDASADVVLAEGVLTIQSTAGKRQIIGEGARLLRPGGRFILHELALRERTVADGAGDTVRKTLVQAMHVNARPHTVSEWKQLLEEAGLQVQMVRFDDLALLEPQRILADEGVVGTLRFARNLARDKQARRRVRTMARTMRSQKAALHAVGLVAVKTGEGPDD